MMKNREMTQKSRRKYWGKKAGALGLAVVLAASLAGCGSSESAGKSMEQETVDYDETYMQSGETIKYETAETDLKVKADIKPSPKEIPEVKMTFYQPEEKTLVRELLVEGMRTEEYGSNCIQYAGKNGDILNITAAGFEMDSDFYNAVSNSFHPSTIDGAYNAGEWSKTTDFSFMSRQAALDMVIKRLENCGIFLGDYEASFYCLDYKTLRKEEKVLAQGVGEAPESQWKESWTEDDNCYYIAIRQKFHDIPEYHPLGGIDIRYEDANAAVTAVVSKDGIRYWNVDYVMYAEDTGAFVKILSPQQALDIVIENAYYRNENVEKQKNTLKKMNLCYFSDVDSAGHGGVLSTIPVYQCYIEQKYWDGTMWQTRVQQLVIDAQTGEEVQTSDLKN